MPGRDSPPRLGRGLAALFGETAEPGHALPLELRIDELEAGPFQPRKPVDPSTLDELVQSIRAQGILQPILVRANPEREGRYQIIAGERRWRAARLAGLEVIPVVLRPMTDRNAMAAGLIENLQRRDLDPLEEAEGFRRLMHEFELTQEELGDAVGKSRSHVANSLRLLALPPAVQAQVQAGLLSAGHARAALAHADPETAARTMIARKLSVREAERLSSTSPARNARTSHQPFEDPNVAAVANGLSERLGLSVEINQRGQNGRLTIHYRTLEQLEGVLLLLNAADA